MYCRVILCDKDMEVRAERNTERIVLAGAHVHVCPLQEGLGYWVQALMCSRSNHIFSESLFGELKGGWFVICVGSIWCRLSFRLFSGAGPKGLLTVIS